MEKYIGFDIDDKKTVAFTQKDEGVLSISFSLVG